VVSLHYIDGQNYNEIVRTFAGYAPPRCISHKYVRLCIADMKSYSNPNYRTQHHSAFRLESLSPDQSQWIYDLLLGDPLDASRRGEPNLYFDEVAVRFERQ
jgi:hypothetical protein